MIDLALEFMHVSHYQIQLKVTLSLQHEKHEFTAVMMLCISHVRFHVGPNMVESRSEQIVCRNNQIIETLQRTHSYWSNPVQEKLCGPEKLSAGQVQWLLSTGTLAE